jgi:hypothetical protein
VKSCYQRLVDESKGTVTHFLRLVGQIPSKKNMYRRVTVRGKPALALSDRAVALMDPHRLQLQSLWKLPPVEHPDVVIKLGISNDASDRDGVLVSLLDLLQPRVISGHLVFAGVIQNDNVRRFNGVLTILPADICPPGSEFVEIWLTVKNEFATSPTN